MVDQTLESSLKTGIRALLIIVVVVVVIIIIISLSAPYLDS